MKMLGWILIAVSTLAFIFVFVVPFLDLSTAQKIGYATGLAIFSEITFWIGGFILGREFIRKYRAKLNPMNWFRPKETEKNE